MINMYSNPSFYAHLLNGAFLLMAAYIALISLSSLKRADSLRLVCITLLFSIAVGVHGLSHLGLETVYGYNPLRAIRSY